jgi:hypothetical protein
MGFTCGTIGGGINDGMGQDNSGIRSLLRPLEQRLRSNNQEEVNSFLDEIDKMANDRFGDAIKKNTDLYNTQRDEFFKGLQNRIQPYMSEQQNRSDLAGTSDEFFTTPKNLYGNLGSSGMNYHASKTILE